MFGQHPNRTVIFIDDAVPLAHSIDPNNHDNTYYLGFSLSDHVRSQIEDFEPTLVHITVPDLTCLHLINYARQKELPLMGTYHSNIPDYMTHYPGCGWLKYILESFFRHQYNFLQALYVPTPYIRKQLVQSLHMDQITKLQVWGRGIDLERFSPKHRSREFRSRMGFSDKDVVLLWVGRLVPEKRPDIFIDVIRKLNARNIPFKALVVGAGPSEETVKSLPNTKFAGWLNGDDLAKAYASSDVFLFPSAVETFGNVSLEAAASGLPIVVEEGCGGHLVRHGISGFACHEHDLDGFFKSVLCLLLDSQRRKSMATEGRKLSMNFEKRTVCEKMLENYRTVTNEFFSEFGGRHANRDAVYLTKDHSFISGSTPRPLVLCSIEQFFLFWIRLWYRMAMLFMFCRERMVYVPKSSSKTLAEQTKDQQGLIPVTVGQEIASQGVELDDIPEMDEEIDLEDMDVSYPQETLLPKIKEEDYDIDTESTHTECTSSSTASLNVDSFIYPQEDRHFSYRMSARFVQGMYACIRLENRLRKGSGHKRNLHWNLSTQKRKVTDDPDRTYEDDENMKSPLLDEGSCNLRRGNSSIGLA
ncbi:unnamed protein product [Cylindrotheca closterium]|uniref:Glycosyltransferase subfamily 4-like N-terminal domain-containing protein n=1 Tax=Cylindrotheca closterium TaxID=2856 RepID=A0AAD2CPU3_9STRA|nr:unnamed protein product [Cylindrotheca closterium]